MLFRSQAADYPTENPDDDLLGEEDLSPAARRCSKEVRRLVRNAHRNLGHPSNFALVRLMTVAKCHPDMIAYASEFKCPTCQRRKPPERIPKATMPYRPTQFNQVVGIDLKWIKAHQKWVKERANKFVGPMTVKVKTDGTIEFFGGTLIMALTCKRCDGWYGKEYSFDEPLDIKSYKSGDYHVLKNLIPENLLEKAVVRRIYVSQNRGMRKLKPKYHQIMKMCGIWEGNGK